MTRRPSPNFLPHSTADLFGKRSVLPLFCAAEGAARYLHGHFCESGAEDKRV